MSCNRTYAFVPVVTTPRDTLTEVRVVYVHPAFRMAHEQAFALLQDRAFGTLVVADSAGKPIAVHLPFLTQRRADGGCRVELHVAKANRLHELVAPDGHPALLICQGPDAYISPDWYGVPNQVPTWTYASVHLSGTLRSLPEEDGPMHVERLSAQYEKRLAPKLPWTADKIDPQRRAAMMRAIVTFELVVPCSGIEAQNKLIQHKGILEHRGAIAGLRDQGDASSVAIADMMESNQTARGE